MAVKGMSKDYGFYAASQKQCCKYLHENYLSRIFEEKINEISMIGRTENKEKRGSETLTVADYGAADARNSVEIYQDVAKRVNQVCKSNTEKGSVGSQPHLILEIQDLPSNNWNSVRDNCAVYLASKYDKVLAQDLSNPNRCFLDGTIAFKGTNVSINLRPSDFYETENLPVPHSTVDIAFTSISTHWLSERSMRNCKPLICSTFYASPTISKACDKLIFQKASIEDGVRFLCARAQELRPGGKLLMCNQTRLRKHDAASLLDNNSAVSLHWKRIEDKATSGDECLEIASYSAVMEDIQELINEWKENPDLKLNSAAFSPLFPAFVKSLTEWDQCFSHPDVVKSGLVLNRTELKIFDNPYYLKVFGSKTKLSNNCEDISRKNHEFAEQYMSSIMAFGGTALKNAFDGNLELVDKFCQELKAKYLSKNPERYRNDYVNYFCEATKI